MISDRKAFAKLIGQAQEEIEKMDTFEAKARERLTELVAQAWCAPENSAKEMDIDLAMTIVDQIFPYVRDTHNAALEAAVAVLNDDLFKPEHHDEAIRALQLVGSEVTCAEAERRLFALKVEKPEI